MASIKEDFYRLIGNDYYERQEKSFVYMYLKKEKESHFRIQLRYYTDLLIDVRENRIRFVAFLLESADKDVLIQKNIKKLIRLTDLLEAVFAGSDAEMPDGNIREQIALALKLLRHNRVEDVDAAVIEALAGEMETIYDYDKERLDVYIEITEKFLIYKQGGLAGAEYLIYLIELVLSKSKMSIGKKIKKDLADYGAAICGDDTFGRLVSEKAIMSELANVLRAKKNVAVPYDILYDMTEDLKDKILKRDVATLLYDAGYSGDAEKNSRTRKKDRSMDMLDAYCRKNGISLFAAERGKAASDAGDEDEYYKSCDKLLEMLNAEKRNDVFLPLMVDNVSGASVCIIGKDYYPRNFTTINKSCVYGYVRYNGVDRDTSMACEIDIQKYDMPSMQEAVLWLDKYVIADTIEAYQDYNGDMPEGCPVMFRSFFSKAAEGEICDDEYADTKQELDAEYEIYKEKVERMENSRKSNE